MSLQVWMPLNGNLNNQGLDGSLEFTNTASATVATDGKIGSCYSFSATSGTGLLLSKGKSASEFMDAYVNHHSWSMCAWVRTTSDDNVVFGLTYGLRLWCGSTNYVHLYNNTRNVSASNNISTIDGKWHHICATYNTLDNAVNVYVDGIKGTTSYYPSGETYASSWSNSVAIGRDFNNSIASSHYYFQGSMNDVRIYDHCLSAKEVKEISKGLSLHYLMNDPYIEPTTNNYSGWSTNCYNGVTGKYNYGTSTDMYYDNLDGIIRVRMGTGNLDAWPYVFFNNITPPSNGEYRTLSFDYYSTIKDKINFYTYNTSGTITWIANGVKGTGGNIPVNTNSWNHISVTIKNTGSYNSGFGYMRIGLEKHTSNTSNYWLFKNIQIESKDHSTGYTSTGTSRSESLCFDASGFGNNGVVRNQSSIFVERDSPRYDMSTVFNGTPFIIGQDLNGAKSTDALSLCAWINPSQVSGDHNIVSSYEGGGAGLHISSGNIYFQIYSGGYINVSGGSVSANTWYHVVGTYDNSKLRIYINGELKGEAAKTGNITYHSGTPWAIGVNPSGTGDGGEHFYGKLSDVRIYSTALSASDVKELYSTSASIDKNGNVYAYEFKEE